MTRKLIGLLCVLVLVQSAVFALDRAGSNYQFWFDNFLKRFQDCSFALTAQDRKDLQDLLRDKPGFGSGGYYNYWFVKGYSPFIEDSLPVIDSNKMEKIEFLLAAMPDLDGSQQYYHFYLDYVVKQIDDFMPVLDAGEKKVLEYHKRALPRSGSVDYQAWLAAYNTMKEDFGPVYSADENYALGFMTGIKPASDPVGQVFQVKAETLMNIRQLILNNQPNLAVQQIDRILSGQ